MPTAPSQSNSPLEPSELAKALLEKRAEIAASYVALYLQHTGLQPDQIVLVEKHSREAAGIKFEWYFEPKSEQTQLPPPFLDQMAHEIAMKSPIVEGHQGDLACFFCGEFQASVKEERHTSDCLYYKVRQYCLGM